MDSLLDSGRVLYCDNWYTSLPLAKYLVQRKTNLVGTCRKNKKFLPKEVTLKKLKRGNLIAKYNCGIMVLKWKDKRDVLMLSTMHDASVNGLGKPKVIEDYNKSKTYVDVSDQMASYSPFVRRTCKWYIRLLFHITTQTMLVNAWRLYCEKQNTKVTLTNFKIEVSRSLLACLPTLTTTTRHVLQKAGPARTSSKRCHSCYETMSKNENAEVARKKSKQVNTHCSNCKIHFCLQCFSEKHKYCHA